MVLPSLRNRHAITFVGTVPAIKPAASTTRSRMISVLATPGTVKRDYTRALIDSGFAPDPARRRAIAPLSGEIPSPFDLPPGCAFAGRCPQATDRCRSERPTLDAATHPAACFHPL